MKMKSSKLFLVIALSTMGLKCQFDRSTEKTSASLKDITIVQEAYTKELMAIKGVVGVYIGALNDGTPCIAIMVDTMTPELAKKLPNTLEGHPVRVEETGKIQPLRK